MKTRIINDAGSLVTLINRRDEHHAWATEQLRLIVPPLSTCEAALAEAVHLLERRTGDTRALRVMLERGFLDVRFSLQAELPSILGLMDRYSNVPSH